MAKKLVNSPDTCVPDCLDGFALMSPHVRLVEGCNVVVRADIEQVKRMGKVTVVTGGGSGHEPAMSGYVGAGMISVAVCGSVFAAPPVAHVEEALLQAGRGGKGGVLLMCANYTGDRLNFEIAAQRVRLRGIDVAVVFTNDDCALESENKMAGRRGLAGQGLVNKIAGSMAEKGRPLHEVAAVAQRVIDNMRTIGIALTACTLPGASSPTFTLPESGFELGLGLHGEAGARRLEMMPAAKVVSVMLDHMTSSETRCSLRLQANDRVVLLLNNLGATTDIEMMTMLREVVDQLDIQHRVKVVRIIVGRLITSLDMQGMSITLLKSEDDWLKLLDEPTEATAWNQLLRVSNPQCKSKLPAQLEKDSKVYGIGTPLSPKERTLVRNCTKAVCSALTAAQERLDSLDKECGDGDCGSTHARAAAAIAANLDHLLQGSLADFFSRLSSVAETTMGGTSGGLYCLFFSALAAKAQHARTSLALRDLLTAFSAGMAAIMAAGCAVPGDRTLIDAMAPFEAYLSHCVNSSETLSVKELVARTNAGSESTAQMRARAGRASYVGGDGGTVDPGAAAFALMVEAAAGAL